MGGWKSAIELVPKIGKVMGKAFGEGGTKAVEQVAKISKAEMKQAKDLRKAEGAIKSIGSPKINVSGVDISRFSYKNGKFWDLKHANTSYSRKEFAQLQSHYSNLFKGGNKSGYKAWERTIPKSNFTPKFNTLNNESKIIGHGSNTAETIAKQRWYQNVENWKKAGKLGVDGMNKTGRAIHGTAEFGFRAARGAIKNSKDLAILAGTGWAAYNIYNGNGIVKPILGAVGGTGAQQGGAVNIAEQLIAGEGAPQLHDNLSGMVNGVVGEAGDVYYRLKDGTIAVADEAGNLYQGGKDMITGAFNGNGMVNDGNGYYSDPTAQQYPSMAQMQMTNQQGGGSMNALMNGMNNAVSQVSGGNVSKMNIASLLLSAYMMFGRFGWMGKAASLLLGGMTLHNINGKQAASQHQNQQQQQSRANVTEQIPLQTAEMPVEEENTVVRMRRL
ncbi:hypothetical protein [Segatella copri]|uniref:Uncharacterized protein n=2 Tax=Prevotellaceae TaxID=171552 RepID=A0AA90UWP2_9BACT|nr:hypothetical protein [Segatella copri]MQN83861.1 hypothetical protein [Segatella copri]WOF96616.1 hypothetical protein RJT12_14470 [Segatella copri]